MAAVAGVFLLLQVQQPAPWQNRDLPIVVASEPVMMAPAPLVEAAFRLPSAGAETYEVFRLSRVFPERVWHMADVIRAPADRLMLRAPAGTETLLLLRTRAHPGYLLDGPFTWPSQPSTYVVPELWRRTVRGTGVRAHAEAPVWIATYADLAAAVPTCAWTSDTEWECIGVALRAAGVALMKEGTQLNAGVAPGALTRPGVEEAETHRSAWGRLAVIEGAPGSFDPRNQIVAAALRLAVKAGDATPTCWVPEPDARIDIHRVAAHAFWIASRDKPPGSWIELTVTGFAPLRLPVGEVAGSPPEVPLRARLAEAIEVRGRVFGGADLPATGASVSLYRFATTVTDPQPVRVLVQQTTAQADGSFAFGGLAMERYELVASHPALGTGARRFTPDGQEVDVPLRRRTDGRR